MEIMTLIESLTEPNDGEKLELEKMIRNFKVDNKAIGTELEGYYPFEEKKKSKPEPDINMRYAWDQLRRDILLYYKGCYDYVKDKPHDVPYDISRKKDAREKTIDEIFQQENCSEKEEDLRREHCEIIQKKHRIIWFILEGPVPEFSLWGKSIVCSRFYKRLKFRHYRSKTKQKQRHNLVNDCINELKNVNDKRKY